MSERPWYEEFAGSVVICDRDGRIVDMNQKACETFAKDGGRALLGRSLFDCHPPQANEKLRALLEQRTTNAYTIEKNGRRKLIYQSPWYRDGEFQGLVELSLELPSEMPHFVRKAS